MMPVDSRTSTHGAQIATLRSRGRGAVAIAAALFMCAPSACGAPTRRADSVVMASGTDLESGNPLVTIHSLTRQMQRHALFVTLVRFDSALTPTPYFARAWAWDGAQRVLTMSLSGALRWHDNVPTTAHDVRFTLEATRDPAVGSPRAGDLRDVDSAHVVSDTVVQLFFRTPQTRVPNILAELPLVPQHLLDTVPRATWRSADFATHPVGNGPFRFVSRVPQRRWVFTRNEAFPREMGGPPALAKIVVAVVDESATKFAGLVSGDLDVAGVSPTMAALVTRDPTLRLLTPPALFSNVLAFNTTRPPFDDARVRRAVSLALDRAQIVQAAVAGYATAAGGAIPPGLPVPANPASAAQPTRADSLLDAAGWTRGAADGVRTRNGKRLEVELLTVGSGDLAIEQLVQADLAARGIALRLRVAEQATFLSTVRATTKAFDVVITGIPGDISLGQLSALFDSAQRGGALDYTGYHTAALDSVLAGARTASPQTFAARWLAVDSMLVRDAPIAWIYHARGVQGLSARVEHVTMDLRGELTSIAQWTRRSTK